MPNRELGHLIDEGISSVAKKQRKNIGHVMEDIGAKTGYTKATIEHWKQGKYAPDAEKLEKLVRYCLRYGRLNGEEWADRVLSQARHPNRKQLLRELFRSEDGGHLPEEGSYAPPLTEFNSEVSKELETPGGAVKLRDELYIEREADIRLRRELLKLGTTTIIRAPRQTGKTSLLIRGVDEARQEGIKIIHINMQDFMKNDLSSLERFLRLFSEFVADELEFEVDLEKLWRGSLSSNVKLTRLFSRHILNGKGHRVILAIDEADRLLYADFASDFFGLIRSWHDTRSHDDRWNRLNTVLVISTEPYLLISDPSQSPFNVGHEILLKDFDRSQVWSLNQRHGSPLEASDIDQFIKLLNGQPYLTRLALYILVTENMSWPQLDNMAISPQSPFSNHLRHQHRLVTSDRDLYKTLREVVDLGRCNDERTFFRLQQAGLVTGVVHQCQCRCDLYHNYFKENLR